VAPPSVGNFEVDGLLEELPALASSRLAIEMEYLSNLERGPVVVTPLYLFESGEHSYMKAYCHRDGLPKTYRLDRIVSFTRA
jgi:predicted DNA-binding transcriptional regulator YafY